MSEDFLEMLADKLREADLPQPLRDLLAAHPERIYTGYRSHDPADIVLLNNKVLALRDLAETAGIAHSPGEQLPPDLAEAVLRMMSRPG